MIRVVKSRVRRLLDGYVAWICKREFDAQSVRRFNERAVEYAYVFSELSRACPRTVLDVGTGATSLPHLMRCCGPMVTAIDNILDYWPDGMINRHYHIIHDDIRRPCLEGTFDFMTCISVLEHIPEASTAVANMLRLLNPGGILVLTFPYTESEYVENVYDLPASSYGQDLPYVCQSFSRLQLEQWFGTAGARIERQEYWQFWTGRYWAVGEKVMPPRRVSRDERHQHTCLTVRKM